MPAIEQALTHQKPEIAIKLLEEARGMQRWSLPVGMAIGFGWVEVSGFEGVRGFWIGLIAGLGVAAVVLTTRFRWLSHRPDRVAQFATR